MKWKIEIKQCVVIGHCPQTNQESEDGKGRWFVWDAPWSEDVKLYGCPKRISYHGKRWCWIWGSKKHGRSQGWDWKTSQWMDYHFEDSFRRLVIFPRNARQIWRKAREMELYQEEI